MMASREPIDPHVVALDAQALREGAWPNPNARLRQLAELAHRFGPHFWLIQGGLDEVRGHAERKAIEAVENLTKARDTARQRGLKAEATSTGLDDMFADWGRAAKRRADS